MDTDRPEVMFYYSIGSRYSYLASTQIESLEADTDCIVRWRPLWSADLMRLRGANPFAGEPISGQYDWTYRQQDAEAWAEYYGVPYREPAGHGLDVRIGRAELLAELLGSEPQVKVG